MILEIVFIGGVAVIGMHAAALWQLWRRRDVAARSHREQTRAWHQSLLLRWSDPLVRAMAQGLQRRAWGRTMATWCAARVLWPYGTHVPSLTLVLHSLWWAGICGVMGLMSHAAPIVVLALVMCGGAIPWLSWRHCWQQWRRQVRRDTPVLLEMLALMVDAGLELAVSAQRLLVVLPDGPLRMLLQRREDDIAMGIPQEQAWRDWAARAGEPMLVQLVAVLLQSQRLGAPVSQVLLDHVAQYHAGRMLTAEQAGMVAGQKLLLPIICCIVPAYFLLTFGGLAVTLLLQGSDGLLRIFL